MPIYEYRCRSCRHEFEKLMRLSDPDPRCPACGHGAVEKLMSAGSIRIEDGFGSGGYEIPGCRPSG